MGVLLGRGIFLICGVRVRVIDEFEGVCVYVYVLVMDGCLEGKGFVYLFTSESAR